MGFKEIIREASESLEREGIPYMIIGGQAVLIYGEPRFTRDIDITVGLGPWDFKKVIKALENFSIIVENPEEFVKKNFVLPFLHSEGVRINIIFSISEYERVAIGRAKAIKIAGKDVKFASPEDVIIHKIVAGRPVDIDDVKSILLFTNDLDRDYIEKWLKEIGDSVGKDFLKTLNEIWD